MKHHISRYLFIAVVALLSISVNAQPLRINVSLSPQHPNNAGDYFYGAKGPNVLVTVRNTTGTNLVFRLVPTLSSSVRGGFSLTFSPSFFPANFINIAANETKVFTFPLLKAHWGPVSPADLQASGKPLNELLNNPLEQGFYQYCFVALDDAGGVVSDNFTNCATFQLSDYDAPRLLYPANNAYVKPLQPQFMVFNWTSVGQPMHTRYRFELVDMTENNLANPEDAFKSPAVRKYFEVADLMSPNLPYNMSYPPLQEGRRYAVRIQAYSMPDYPQKFKNNGYSPVTIFTYEEKKFELRQQAGDAGGQTYSPEKKIKNKKSPKDDMKKDLAGSNKLAKTFKGNDGGIYYVSELTVQNSKMIMWYGEHPDLNYGQVFWGYVDKTDPTLVKGDYADIPKYKSASSGEMKVKVSDDGKKITLVSSTGNISATEWESIDINQYIGVLPPSFLGGHFATADTLLEIKGLYIGEDGGRYHANTAGGILYMVGEPEFQKGSKPGFTKLYVGAKTPLYNHKYLTSYTGHFVTLSKGILQASGNTNLVVTETGFKHYGGNDMGSKEWKRVKIAATKGIDIEPKTTKKDFNRPVAEKSASLVYFYFGDGPLFTIFQNAGINLQYALDGYDKTCLLKKDYSGVNKSPDYHDQPTKANFFKYLKKLADEGYYIDIFVFSHGSRDGIETLESVPFDPRVDIKAIRPQDIISELSEIYGPGEFPIRIVYMMNCFGNNLSDAFVSVGAKAVAGTPHINFFPTRFNVFGKAWQEGKSFYSAIKTSEEDKTANSLAATGINTELKFRMANPLSWKCKSCKTGTSLDDKDNCLGCFFKSFYSFRGITDETKDEEEEYDYSKTGVQNIMLTSKPLVGGSNWKLTKDTKPTW
jgi:hypothetical protein